MLDLTKTVARKALSAASLPDTADVIGAAESKITARLPHAGIPPVHALGTLDDGAPYRAMKRIQGWTLAELLKQRRSASGH